MAKRMWDRYQDIYHREMFSGVYGGSAGRSMAQCFGALETAGTTDPDAVRSGRRGGT